MPARVWESVSLQNLPQVAGQILAEGESFPIWRLEGKMGAGKTTLTKALCDAYGVTDVVNSPTFSLVNEYQSDAGKTIFHFDFYRIKDPQEAMDIGLYEYFDSGNRCIVEWAEKVEPYMPESFFLIEIEPVSENIRRIACTRYE